MPLSTAEIEIANRLLFFRESLKIAQKDVAKGSKSSQGHISEMEKGLKSIQPRVILFLAERYGLNVDWLFTGRGEMQLGELVQEPAAVYRSRGESRLEARVAALEAELKKLKLKHN